MKKKEHLADLLIQKGTSIKDAMRSIDYSGHGRSFVVDGEKLVGVLLSCDVQMAILKGLDVNEPVERIMNSNPLGLLKSDRGRQDRLKTKRGKKILVVGGAGYLGSVLTGKLLARGYKVRVLDLLMFGSSSIRSFLKDNNFEIIKGDMRNISTIIDSLKGVYAVINLAAIVGDPACKSYPEGAIETNYLANKSLAESCKYHQINRYIYASTCSVYGVGEEKLTETSPLNPVSLYARSKILSEEGILKIEDENFSPCILRMSTLYGYSHRMRFDLVVNTMTAKAFFDRRITVHGSGKQWRPLLHVEDAAEAYIACLEVPIRTIKGQVFNIGSDAQNHQIKDIARIVSSILPEAKVKKQGGNEDIRNYIVSFEKAKKIIAYAPQFNVVDGVKGIVGAFQKGLIKNIYNKKYYNSWEQ